MRKKVLFILLTFLSVNAAAIETTVDRLKVDYHSSTTDNRWYCTVIGGEITNSYGYLHIPSTVTISGHTVYVYYIGANAFANRTDIKEIYFDKNNSTPFKLFRIEESAFSGCTNLEEVSFGGSIGYTNDVETQMIIGKWAFKSCTKLKAIGIPNCYGVGDYAFINCTSLERVFVNNVRSFGQHVFQYCSALKTITWYNNHSSIFCNGKVSTEFSSLSDCPFYDVRTYVTTVNCPGEYVPQNLFAGFTALTTVSLESGLKEIGKKAFADCTKLATVQWGCYDLETIGEQAFANCTALTGTLDIHSLYSLKKISDKAFAGTKYTTAKLCHLGDTKLTIGQLVFNSNTSLKTLELVGGSFVLNELAFGNATNLQEVTIDSRSGLLDMTYNYNYSPFYGLNNLQTVHISGNVTLGSAAFLNNTGLTTVDIQSANSCHREAFSGCTNITSVTWGVTDEADVNAFQSTSKINSVTIKTSHVPGYLFQNQKNLKSVSGNFTSVGHYAFAGCGFTQLTFPTTLTEVGDFAFANNPITSLVVPEQITKVGAASFYSSQLTNVSWNAIDCEYEYGDDLSYYSVCGPLANRGETNNITSFAFGNKVTRIPEKCCQYLDKISTLVIPATVTEIGDEAFQYCTSLTTIRSNATTPPTCGSDVFSNITDDLTTISLTTPDDNAYMHADT